MVNFSNFRRKIGEHSIWGTILDIFYEFSTTRFLEGVALARGKLAAKLAAQAAAQLRVQPAIQPGGAHDGGHSC